jgi:puromycin-sensitive aminopeptidase
VTLATSGSPHRLPRTVIPTRYTLALQPDLDAARFDGDVIIDVEVLDPVEHIVLNAIELDIASVRVDGADAAFTLDASLERLVVDAAREPGDVTLEITFSGVLNDKLRGFYRSTYRDADGVEQVIATSQMQTTDCRRTFPCFDEPDFKAVFDVTLVVDPSHLALSNGAEADRTELPIDAQGTSKVAVRFQPTMPMSTYLVAFVVGPLEISEPVMVPRRGGGDIAMRIAHVPGKSHLTTFGLDIGTYSLAWYQDFYELAYPTDKCDMVALPDFAAGAMENLGLITYRENLLLADPATATQLELQTLADVVAHEIAHMWFGDLVTMKWWNGIWLNEAFATFMEIACCDAYRPEWLRWTTFSLERSLAFEIDSLSSTRSVEFPVDAPQECAGMFDVLTYQKGGSLLRMLEQYLGTDAFRKGISLYLAKHAHANTETSDLWDAIEEANPSTPARKMMDSWIWQPGFPLVSARLDGTTLVLSQQRYAFGDTDDPTLFIVPVHLRIDGAESKVLLDGFEARVQVPSADSAVVVNAGGHGFMRVAYDATLRSRLVGEQLATLTIIDRYNLVDDAWNEVVAGRLAALDFLTFLEGFGHERDLAVWQVIANGLRGVGRLIDGEAHVAYRARVAQLVRPALADLGWEPQPGETALTSKLRGQLVSLLAVLGDDADAQQRCRAILDQTNPDPELLASATAAVAAVGTDDDYERYLAAYRSATTPQEQLRFMYALSEFPQQSQIARTVEFAFSDEVKTAHAPFLLNRCIANRWHGAYTWDQIRRRWTDAVERFPDNTIVRMIDPVKLLTATEVAADVQSFFAEHPIPQSTQTLHQVLERQRVNVAMRSREEARLSAALLEG